MNVSRTSPPTNDSAQGYERSATDRIRSSGRKSDIPRGGKMERFVVRKKIAKHGMRNSNVLAIVPIFPENPTLNAG